MKKNKKKNPIVESAKQGRRRFWWSFDRLEAAEEYLTLYSSEKRLGKLFDTETGELLWVMAGNNRKISLRFPAPSLFFG